MTYTIRSQPTRFRGVNFRSRLEARWAAFFQLAGWRWEYEPYDISIGPSKTPWNPDFLVSFPCSHSECPGSHSLLIEVKPYQSMDEFKSHQAYGLLSAYETPAIAFFGANPDVTLWEMCHGAGGGEYSVGQWVAGCGPLWDEAKNLVQFIGSEGQPK